MRLERAEYHVSRDLEVSSLIASGHHPGFRCCPCPMIAVITERSDDDDVGPPPGRQRKWKMTVQRVGHCLSMYFGLPHYLI